jgi:hypothetical protein
MRNAEQGGGANHGIHLGRIHVLAARLKHVLLAVEVVKEILLIEAVIAVMGCGVPAC